VQQRSPTDTTAARRARTSASAPPHPRPQRQDQVSAQRKVRSPGSDPARSSASERNLREERRARYRGGAPLLPAPNAPTPFVFKTGARIEVARARLRLRARASARCPVSFGWQGMGRAVNEGSRREAGYRERQHAALPCPNLGVLNLARLCLEPLRIAPRPAGSMPRHRWKGRGENAEG
jgi:hypothetical protein